MKDDRVYLGHILDAISDIEQYTAGGRDAFMRDRMQQDAVIGSSKSSGKPSSTFPSPPRIAAPTFRGSA